MREIKFKAWDKKNNRMANVDSIEFVDALEGRTGINVYVEGKRNSYWLEAFKDEYELLQYTGLKDTNGKEIYEGDILKAEDPYREKTKNIAVEFINGAYHIEWSNMFYEETDITTIYWAKDMDFSFEIIGNIYQNPKLLKNE
jgi:uncharacterized phage protein (TIGR01671 family)